MAQKIIIVGGVAGGATAAAKLRRNSEKDQIIMFEKGPHVSFSNCSLPYHLSGMIPDADDLVLMSPKNFLMQYRIDARTSQEVTAISRDKKTVTVHNIMTNDMYEESYDKLILSPGAFPIVPDILGIEKMNVFTIRNVVDIDRLSRFVKQMNSREVTVIGGGYVGIEAAENLQKAGFHVTLVEMTDQILRPFDNDMVQIFHKVMLDHDIHLILGEKVVKFTEKEVILSSGLSIEAGAVVMAAGVLPETILAKEADLKLGTTGAILVDHNFKTSDPDIYAVGDAVEVYHALTHAPMKLSLAGPALKQARSVADHIHHKITPNRGYIGSNAISLFDYNGASTGLNEFSIQKLPSPISYEIVRIILPDKVGVMPGSSPLHFKLIFEVPTGKVLGAQAIGRGDVTKRIDVIATAIRFGATVEDLRDLELSYAPPFSTAKDIVNYAGYVGSNLLYHEFSQINIDKVRDLVKQNAYILDVREVYEYERGHIMGSSNIPLSVLRDRIDEIPKDKPIYIHCRTGQRSYNASLILKHLGFSEVYNVTGGFLGLSFYEYFHDIAEKRDPIVTQYNFR